MNEPDHKQEVEVHVPHSIDINFTIDIGGSTMLIIFVFGAILLGILGYR